MTRYTVAVRRKTPARNQEPSPIWRGIGCVLMLVVPLARGFWRPPLSAGPWIRVGQYPFNFWATQ